MGIYAIMLGIHIFQLLISSAWLHLFEMGPMEWLWRSLIYGKCQELTAEKTVAIRN